MTSLASIADAGSELDLSLLPWVLALVLLWAAVRFAIRWHRTGASLEAEQDAVMPAPEARCAVHVCVNPWTHSNHGWRTCEQHTPDWSQINAAHEDDDLAVADLALWELETGWKS